MSNLARKAVRGYTRFFPFTKGKGRLVEATRRWTASPGPIIATVGDGYRMELELTDHIQRWIYFFGYYEPAFARLLNRVLRPGDTFVDCGANIGQFSVIAARKVGANGRVLAIEPESRNFEQLRRNLLLNAIPHARAIQTAIGKRSGVLDFYTREAEGGFTNRGVHSLHPHTDWQNPRKVSTPIDLLDNILAGEARIDAIKFDIEGAELEALQGSNRILQKFEPLIFLEANEICSRYFGYGTTDVKRWLLVHGHQLARLDRAGRLTKCSDESEVDALIVAYKPSNVDRIPVNAWR